MAAVLRLNVKLQFLNLQKEKKHSFNRCTQYAEIFTISGESHFIENYVATM